MSTALFFLIVVCSCLLSDAKIKKRNLLQSPGCPPPVTTPFCFLHLLTPIDGDNGDNGVCVAFANATGQVTIVTPNQNVYMASNEAGTISPYFDEVGILTVTAPDGTVTGANYRVWQATCENTQYKDIFLAEAQQHGPIGPTCDITPLFGGECGTFTIDISVRNAWGEFTTSDVWICTEGVNQGNNN